MENGSFLSRAGLMYVEGGGHISPPPANSFTAEDYVLRQYLLSPVLLPLHPVSTAPRLVETLLSGQCAPQELACSR